VEPGTIEFEVAKSVAEHIKMNILTKASFDDIEVAIWDVTTSSGAGRKPPSLDPKLDRTVTEFRHPFASTLGIAVAPLKRTGYGALPGDSRPAATAATFVGITAVHLPRQ
jgi:hypothetical protein